MMRRKLWRARGYAFIVSLLTMYVGQQTKSLYTYGSEGCPKWHARLETLTRSLVPYSHKLSLFMTFFVSPQWAYFWPPPKGPLNAGSSKTERHPFWSLEFNCRHGPAITTFRASHISHDVTHGPVRCHACVVGPEPRWSVPRHGRF